MNADLEKLVHLHQAESHLRQLDSEIAALPGLRQELEERLARERARLDGARADLEQSQKTRRQLETEVQDLEGKRSRYKGQLMEVKTNKEYTAMLHEIEGVEREISSREDRILEEMERAEALQGDVRREEADFRQVEATAATEKAALDAREKQLGEQRARQVEERDTIAASVPEQPLQLYQRIAGFRGSGVAEARDGMCQTCHVKLRLQMWVELRHNETLQQCPSCQRILYYETPPPDAVAEP